MKTIPERLRELADVHRANVGEWLAIVPAEVLSTWPEEMERSAQLLEQAAEELARLAAEVARLESVQANSLRRIEGLLGESCERNRKRNEWGQTMMNQRDEARAEIARLRAEVAEARDDLRRECEASQQVAYARHAAQAHAARLEEALEELLRVSGWASTVSTYDEWWDAAIAARRALTEGADHAYV